MDENTQKTLLGAITIAIGTIGTIALLFAYLAAVGGFALSMMWRWFLMPLGLPAIGIANAAGIILIIRFVIVNHGKKSSETNWPAAFLGPWIVLGMAWIVKVFM